MTKVATEVKKALKHYFGFDSFRGKQEEVVNSVMKGRDVFVIMPTGAGKSLCYQLPAIVKEGTALVISPLIALMKNQVDHMQSLGIEAGFLNSSLSKGEYDKVKQKALDGVLKLLYVAPESLVKEEFVEFLQQITLSFVAVDEAHCISEWGHDFRPEYRRIRQIIEQISKKIPIIALTATATPKVQQDIQQNLKLENADVYISSFNRTNLYYEIRPKINVDQELVKYIKQNHGKSGIVYCLSRKKTEELTDLLKLNNIKAVPYHAGLDSETRNKHQDMFLKEDVQVVVATIAFGMGIDKPDVRFVIHYDVPKSIEGYYQETGRAGRDGLEGNCILFYDYDDIQKLEKFMKDKPVSERESSKYLLQEMAYFCESGICRRKYILHYFGEVYEEKTCSGMCDNCRHPKEKVDATDYAKMVLQLVHDTGGKFPINYLVNLLVGQKTQQIRELKHDKLKLFGAGSKFKDFEWKSVIVQLIVNDYLLKDITDYGIIKLTDKGKAWLKKPEKIQLVRFAVEEKPEEETLIAEDFKAYDEDLFEKLKKLRKQIANSKNVPPYVILQDPSLEEMALKYPITLKELQNIKGVGAGQVQKYGQQFLEVIKRHVEENEIERPVDLIVKSSGKNSADKLFIIQQIDRKTPLDEIALMKGWSFQELIQQVENIIYSGTKLNIKYFIDQIIDKDKQEEILEYFQSHDSFDLEAAQRELGDDFEIEEIQLMRAKYYSEMAN